MASNDLHNLLILRLELQRAVAHFASSNQQSAASIQPWNCSASSVSDAWNAFASSDNIDALEEWLAAERSNGQSTEWTEKAIEAAKMT
jgi:hypothetical protein